MYASRLPLLHRLIAQLKSTDAVWNASTKTLAACGLKQKTIQGIIARKALHSIDRAHEELNQATEHGWFFLCKHHAHYPELLRHIAQPPLALYGRGSSEACQVFEYPYIAIVGSRKPSRYGTFAAKELTHVAATLGWSIVSGLAFGIDAIAHTQAIANNAYTPPIAVLGGGVSPKTLSPRSHAKLAERIIDFGGAVISEYPFEQPSMARFFPERNRIIAGIARATIVVEGTAQSGSLITGTYSLEENRDVYAIPGEIYNPQASAPNTLITQGAAPIISADHFRTLLYERYQLSSHKTQQKKKAVLSPKLLAQRVSTYTPTQQQLLLHGFEHPNKHTSIQTMLERTAIPHHLLMQELTLLEIEGVITRESNGSYYWTLSHI